MMIKSLSNVANVLLFAIVFLNVCKISLSSPSPPFEVTIVSSKIRQSTYKFEAKVTRYDGNVDELQYAWVCAQVKPSFGPCPFELMNADSKSIIAKCDGCGSTTSRLVVVATDPISDRSAVMASEVNTELDPSAPKVQIAPMKEPLNVNERLVFTGSVTTTDSPCYAVWSTNDVSIDLEAHALTPVRTFIPPYVNRQVNLVLAPYALMAASREIQFELTCDELSQTMM